MKLFNTTYKPQIKEKTTVKMTAFFEHLKTYVSYYLAITTVIGILWGGFTIYDRWRDGNKEVQKSVKIIINTQAQQAKADSILLKNQMEMRIDLNALKSNSDIYIKRIDALQRSYIEYISNDKALTKTDFLQYMDGLNVDVKKN